MREVVDRISEHRGGHAPTLAFAVTVRHHRRAGRVADGVTIDELASIHLERVQGDIMEDVVWDEPNRVTLVAAGSEGLHERPELPLPLVLV